MTSDRAVLSKFGVWRRADLTPNEKTGSAQHRETSEKLISV